jgi:hypothetical protein
MLRKMLFAIVPMVLAISTVQADDTLDLDLTSISDAAIEIEEPSLDDLDVDALAEQADGEQETDAIEACFRRFGYRHYGYGYGYGYRCYRPYYSYRVCHPTYYVYRPVYHHYAYPVVTYHSYWGCY